MCPLLELCEHFSGTDLKEKKIIKRNVQKYLVV